MFRPIMSLKILMVLAVLVTFLNSFVTNKKTTCVPCVCFSTTSGNVVANCSNLGLTTVPKTLPVNITVLTLTFNNISMLHSETFKTFHNLRTLDLSMNKLDELRKCTFEGLHKVLELNLAENNLKLKPGIYPKNLFKPMKMLRRLKLNKNTDTTTSDLDYPDDLLSQVHHLEELFIDGLPGRSFGPGFLKLTNLKMLILSGFIGNCNLTHVTNKTFKNIPYIQVLDISNCGISSIDAGSFLPLKKIRILDLSSNVNLGLQKVGLSFFGLQKSPIRSLYVNNLYAPLGLCTRMFTDDVKYLKNTSLSEFHADSNQLDGADPGVFDLLPSSLKFISVKYNRITAGMYLWNFLNNSGLEELDASYQRHENGHWPPSTSMQEIKMSDFMSNEKHNQLLQIKKWQEFIYFSKQLAYLNNINEIHSDQVKMSERTAPTGESMRIHGLNKPGSPEIPTLQTFRMPQHGSRPETYFSSHLPQTTSDYGYHIFPFPPNLKRLNLSFSMFSLKIPSFTVKSNKLALVDLSNNFITELNGPIHGFGNLTHLNISNNICRNISGQFLPPGNKLIEINLSKNDLGISLEYDINGSVFQNMKNVKYFYLAFNEITSLPTMIFKGLTSVEKLDLSNNDLTMLDISVYNMKKLRHLNLAYNQLQWLSEDLREGIDRIVQVHKLELDLRGNHIACSCNGLSFLKWMQNTKVKFVHAENNTCRLSNGNLIKLRNIEKQISVLEKQCHNYLGIVTGALLGVLFFLGVVLAAFVYRYRWKLRYLYYMTMNKYTIMNTCNNREEQFQYDVFVSYADDDRGFVIGDMINKLEHEAGFKLCIHHRDFLPGNAIASNIINAINTSRLTIILLSSNFLKSYWCRYEVEMARMEGISRGQNVILVVLLEKVRPQNMSSEILHLMQTDTYIEYSCDVDGNALFWEKLSQFVRNN